MAMSYTITTGSSTSANFPVLWTGSSGYMQGVTYVSGGSANPADRTPAALEWLDAEIEATCRLARLAA
jgi:hypothetical protein